MLPVIRKRVERGQSFVELALLLPILLVLAVGIGDLAFAMWTYSVMANAAQEGAAYASYAPADTAGIDARVRATSSVAVNWKDTEAVQVAVQNLSIAKKSCEGEPIQVTVSTRYNITTPFVGALLGRQWVVLAPSAKAVILSPTCP